MISAIIVPLLASLKALMTVKHGDFTFILYGFVVPSLIMKYPSSPRGHSVRM